MSEGTKCKCDNCGAIHKIDELDECRDFWSRVARPSPGSEMPAGDCPICGAFSYIMKTEDEKAAQKVKDAAPDLLEACRKALPWLGTLSNLTPGYITLPMDIEMLEQAIVKATGQ